MNPIDIPTDRESGPNQPVSKQIDVFTVDHQSLQARKKKRSSLSCRLLCVAFGVLVVLGISGFFTYIMFLAAKIFWNQVIDPHQFAVANSSHIVVQSYYGKRVPRFDVVASVFVRTGGELAEAKSSENSSSTPFLNETQQFGQWQLLFSERVFSQIDINSTEKMFHTTVDLPIQRDVLSQFYKPHTYFPQIVNTFVIVPSNPDPIFDPSSSGSLAPFNLVEHAYSNLTRTPWPRSPLQKLSRPIDPDHNDMYSPRLDAFYDATAVREFALRPVRDRWTSFDRKNDTSRNSQQTTNLHQVGTNLDDLDERQGLRVKRNATIKIKTRSHLSMAKAIPDYDLFLYMSKRDNAAKGLKTLYTDPLNRQGPVIGHHVFLTSGHYQSHILHSPETAEAGVHGSFFYGPYLTLHNHAAGGQDWFTLPRVDESSNRQSETDPLIVPWHITFDLLSNAKLNLIDHLDLWGNPIMDDYHPTKAAYAEAGMLENSDLKNSLLRSNPTSSQRSILRIVFFFLGIFFSCFIAGILQLHYLYTRSTSAGISLPSAILNLVVTIVLSLLEIVSPPPNEEDFSVFETLLNIATSLVALWPYITLWSGIEFTWASWSYIPVPTGLKRFKPDHKERMSRRFDQQFTWVQKGLTIAVMMIFFIYLPKFPYLISSPLHDSSFALEHPLPPFYSNTSSWSEILGAGLEQYGNPFAGSFWFMTTLSQVFLNKRLGTFGGSYPIFAWIEVIGTTLSWVPVVFASKFGKFESTAPLDFSVFLIFSLNLVLLWQAVTLPSVSQEQELDE